MVLIWLKKQISSSELYVAIVATIISGGILFTSPINGVANNGDYGRIMQPAGLEFIKDTRYTNIDQYFRLGEPTVPPGQ